jgi:hypothetical protein
MSVVVSLLRDLVDVTKAASSEQTHTLKEVQRRLERHEAEVELREVVTPPAEEVDAVLGRVRGALRKDVERDLVWRDVKVALEHFQKLGVGDVGRLLDAFERPAWGRFVAALFKSRVDLAASHWEPWADLLGRAPRSLALLAGTPLRRKDLLEPEVLQSASLVGKWVEAKGLLQVLEQLCAPGLMQKRWPYVAVVLAQWVRAHPEAWAVVWKELQSEPLLEALLLPRDPRGKTVLGGEEPKDLPIGAPDVLLAQGAFAAAVLELAANPKLAPRPEVEVLQSVFLAAREFGDPRAFKSPRDEPESAGWKAARLVSPVGYEALIERLISADLELFFNEVAFDLDRRAFWLQYKRQVNQSILCLRPDTKRGLMAKLRARAGTTQLLLLSTGSRQNRVVPIPVKLLAHDPEQPHVAL